MGYLQAIASKIDTVDLYLYKRNYDTYRTTLSVSYNIQQDWNATSTGVLYLSFTLPSDTPDWNDLFLESSYLYFYNEEIGNYIIEITLSTLEKLGYSSWTPGQPYTIKLCILSIYGA